MYKESKKENENQNLSYSFSTYSMTTQCDGRFCKVFVNISRSSVNSHKEIKRDMNINSIDWLDTVSDE